MRRSSCRPPTSPGFRLLAQARYPEALASLRAAAAADPLVTVRRAPDARSIRPTSAHASRKPTRWWRPAIGRRRTTACSTPCAGSRTRARRTGAWAGWMRTGGDQAARAAVVRRGVTLCAGGGCVDRVSRRSGDSSTPRSTSTPPPRAYERRVDAGAAFRAGPSRPRRRVSGAGPARGCARRISGGGARRSRQRERAFASAGQLRADLGDDQGAIALLRSRRAARRQPRRGALRARPGAAAGRTRRRVAAATGGVRTHPEGRDGGAAAPLRREFARTGVGAA